MLILRTPTLRIWGIITSTTTTTAATPPPTSTRNNYDCCYYYYYYYCYDYYTATTTTTTDSIIVHCNVGSLLFASLFTTIFDGHDSDDSRILDTSELDTSPLNDAILEDTHTHTWIMCLKLDIPHFDMSPPNKT